MIAPSMFSGSWIMDVIAHELAHRSYDRLDDDKKEKLIKYFVTRDSLRDAIVAYPLYQGLKNKPELVVTEQVAFIIGRLVTGEDWVKIGEYPGDVVRQPGWHKHRKRRHWREFPL